MKRILFLFILLNFPLFGYCQFLPKDIEGNDVKQCEDEGFIVVNDFELQRTDRNGNLLWRKNFIIPKKWFSSVQITNDGGFILAGHD